MAKSVVQLLQKHFPEAVIEVGSEFGDEWALVRDETWWQAAEFLRDNPQSLMTVLIDLTAVDRGRQEPRFEVVAHLMSPPFGYRLRLKTWVGDEAGSCAEVQSLSDMFASANWLERECFDLFGVRFIRHPDLRRLLTYPEFAGHPLRKDHGWDEERPLVSLARGSKSEEDAP
jgi:NADH-quinone oxidoreductase subunit C